MNFLTTFSFPAIKNTFLLANLPICKTVGVLPLLFISEFSKEHFTSHNQILLENVENAHLTLLFCRGWRRNQPDCILHVQFHCVARAVSLCGVVVFLKSLHCSQSSQQHRYMYNHWSYTPHPSHISTLKAFYLLLSRCYPQEPPGLSCSKLG